MDVIAMKLGRPNQRGVEFVLGAPSARSADRGSVNRPGWQRLDCRKRSDDLRELDCVKAAVEDRPRSEDAERALGAPGCRWVATLSGLCALGVVAVLPLLTGCKGWSVSQCVSPQVKGRVLDDQTHQPIADVQVQRVAAHARRTDDAPPKGGQLMEKAPRIVLSRTDGTFDLDGEYSVAAFQVITWNSVDVQFRRAGYLSFTTNFTPSMASSRSNRVCVEAGDILLKRDPNATNFPSSP